MTHTADDARTEIIDAIESTGTVHAEDFDIDAILSETYNWDDKSGYVPAVDVETFWAIVQRHDHGATE